MRYLAYTGEEVVDRCCIIPRTSNSFQFSAIMSEGDARDVDRAYCHLFRCLGNAHELELFYVASVGVIHHFVTFGDSTCIVRGSPRTFKWPSGAVYRHHQYQVA